ncbi:LIC_12616 family protein [Paenibacillus alvei]|uniref:phage neck terminator protein n=1 Tax=Paenibacillus alvei TaxID=44250 RepID=UPI00227F7BE1|nr:hypothetical protein [Paenibacillus alvei]MCY7484431.1 hypothetical protein [Paenibacillus alvei]
MVPFRNIRSAIVRGLKEYMNLPVIEMNGGGDVPAGEFMTYHFPDGFGEPSGQPIYEQENNTLRQIETVTFSVSFLSYAADSATSIENAMRACDWFKGAGHDILKDAVNVVVVEVGSIENRDIVMEEVWERRHGFEVEFRTLDVVETELVTINTTNIQRG